MVMLAKTTFGTEPNKIGRRFPKFVSEVFDDNRKDRTHKKLYGPYIKAEYSKKYAVNIRNRFKAESMHLIITNYNI